jgi:rod shape-determining protein MreC
MQQIIYFFIRNKNFLLFAFLFIVSVLLTIQTHNYHNDKFLSSANSVTGGIYRFKHNLTDYFSLGRENKNLLEENLQLRQELEAYEGLLPEPPLDSLMEPKFEYLSATVINNNYSKTKNQLTLDKGRKDSLKIDMGVVSNKGLIGIISDVSKNYATVQSILNTKSRINAKLKKSSHFGTLIWDTKAPNVVQLIDIPRLANLKKGDTIITGGRSTIFPEGILIGTIKDFHPDKDDNYYYVNVNLFNDMTGLQYVYLIKNNHAEEILNLEKKADDAK